MRTRHANLRLVLLLATMEGAALARPAVTTSPSIGPPNHKITVSGSGFRASELVDLYFDTTDLEPARADSVGVFSKPLTIPETAVPGKHTVSATGRKSGRTARTTFLVRTDWRQFRHGPLHDSYNPDENVLSASNASSLQLLWKTSTGGYVSSPVVADGKVYVGTAIDLVQFQVEAFDAATGRYVWSASGAGDGTSPGVVNGTVYIPSGFPDGNMYAFGAATGQPMWSAFGSFATVTSPATIADGAVFAGWDVLLAWDAATGRQLWSFTAPSQRPFDVFPATVVNGVVYAGCLDGYLYAIDAGAGAVIWSRPNMAMSPAAAGGVLYGVVPGGSLEAVDAATGKPIWSTGKGSATSPPAVANGIVYAGTTGNQLTAFNAGTGRPLWSTAVGEGLSYPAIANGVLYVSMSGGKLAAFNGTNGQLLWSTQLGTAPYATSPVVANGVVYVCDYNGVIYAFGLQPGSAADPARRHLLE